MLKIVYVLPYLEHGGTETHVLELIKGFKDKYELILLAPPGPRLPQFKQLNIKHYPFKSLNQNLISGLVSFKKNLIKLNKIQPQLFHLHAAHEYLPLLKLFTHNIPTVFTIHGYHGPFHKFDYKISSFFINLWSEAAITVSRSERELMLKSGINKNKLNLIYNGVSLPENYSSDNIPGQILSKLNTADTIIGAAGRLEKAKGFNCLIKAFSHLAAADVHLLIMGTGQQENKLKKQVKELNLNNKITFTGYVNNIHDYFEAVDIFTVPSLREPFGLVAAEAMAHKLPVVATSTGGLPEVVSHGKTGYIVPPGNSQQLSAKLQILITNRGLSEKMGKKGFARYQKLFRLENQLEKVEAIYQRLLNENTC